MDFREKILHFLVPENESEALLGDFREIYADLAVRKGRMRAKLWLWSQIIRFIPAFFTHSIIWSLTMFKNYLLLTARNLSRQKLFAAINILGLSIGISCTIIVYAFIKNELTYDGFHKNADRIYRTGIAINFSGLEYWDNTPYPLGGAIEEEIAGVENIVRFTGGQNMLVRAGNEPLNVKVHLVSPDFLEMFHFPLRVGSPKRALSDPRSVVITEKIKARYFPNASALGERIAIALNGDEFVDFTISGITEAIPGNSSIQFDLLISDLNYARAFGESSVNSWFPKSATVTFLKTQPGADFEKIQLGLKSIAEKHDLGAILRVDDEHEILIAEKLQDAHFGARIKNRFLEPATNPRYAWILGGVAGFVLLIACINFMNLATALSSRRTKEVGVRKVFGARRLQLQRQFLFESVLMSVVALGAGLVIAVYFLPVFNSLAGKNISFNLLIQPENMLVLLLIAIVTGLIAGSYPALVLSKLIPVRIFQKQVKIGRKNAFTQSLIVFQFAISIFLIASTQIMSGQLNFLIERPLGMDTEMVIFQNLTKRVSDDFVARFRTEAQKIPGVLDVSGSRGSLFGESPGSMWRISYKEQNMTLAAMKVDEAFIDVMGVELLEGRNLSRKRPADLENALLVNEMFVKTFEMESPVGKAPPFQGAESMEIAGVVKDFHFQSLRKEIEPIIMNFRPDSENTQVMTRLETANLNETLRKLGETWNALEPGQSFDYVFFDEAVAKQYEAEQNLRTIAGASSWLAVIIACLGLLGLTSLSVTRRTKEIGVRKVLGASSFNILSLFQREFILLIVAALFIAAPAAYFLMEVWLENFAYKREAGLGVFLFSGAQALLVALLTINLQAWRAANTNPVSTLHDE